MFGTSYRCFVFGTSYGCFVFGTPYGCFLFGTCYRCFVFGTSYRCFVFGTSYGCFLFGTSEKNTSGSHEGARIGLGMTIGLLLGFGVELDISARRRLASGGF